MCVRPMFRCTKYDGTIEIRNLKQIDSYLDKTNRLESLYGFFISRYKEVQPFPCGYCPDCLAKKSMDWSTRCFCESTQHLKNSFITLTYDDNKLDEYDYEPLRGISLIKKDLSNFIKRLRYRLYQKNIHIKFFACGEYGDKNGRPHFHVLIFGYDFPDKVKSIQMFSKRKKEIFESEELNDLWKFGLASVQDVTPQSCNYVSKYILKKKFGRDKESYYTVNILGYLHKIEKEYNTMSKREPIGKSYFEKYLDKIFDTEKIQVDYGKLRSLPKVFYEWLKKVDYSKFLSIKIEHLKNMVYEFDIDKLFSRELAKLRKNNCLNGVF